jgi:Abortive infection alpha
MPAEDIATEIAKEIVKQLPVKQAYNDLAAPAAAETGQFFGDLAKALRLVLVPIQVAAAYQDRVRAFIDRSIRAVPERERIAPPPQILGPVLEGVRYEVDGTPIDEMFSALLSNSMSKAKHASAHPAFPGIIKNLAADEARILKALATKPIEQIASAKYDRARNLFEPSVIEKLAIPKGLDFPENAQVYFDHLTQLGLIEISATRTPEAIMSEGVQVGVRNFGEHQLTRWGRQFIRACLP